MNTNLAVRTKNQLCIRDSQCISMGMSFYYFFLSGRSRLHIQLKHFRPDMTLLREIVFIGFPSFLQLSGTSFSLIAANRFLRQYGNDLAISVYGLVNKIDVFFRFPVSGLIQGIQPIIGQNYGAGTVSYTHLDVYKRQGIPHKQVRSDSRLQTRTILHCSFLS